MRKICLNCGKPLKGKQTKYCSNKCQRDYEYCEYINKWMNNQTNGLSGKYGLSRHIRRYMLEINDFKCELCGWGETNHFTNKIPLEIHHKDGDYRNNSKENLQVLCPNCHSLTGNYKSRCQYGRKERHKYYKQ